MLSSLKKEFVTLATYRLKIHGLIVEQPVEFVSPLKDIAKPEKSAVLLECEVSKLNAQVEWSRNKQPITVQDGYDIKSDNTYHTLHLDNVGPDDTAEFTVAVDEKTSTSKLTVKGIKTFFSLVH